MARESVAGFPICEDLDMSERTLNPGERRATRNTEFGEGIITHRDGTEFNYNIRRWQLKQFARDTNNQP